MRSVPIWTKGLTDQHVSHTPKDDESRDAKLQGTHPVADIVRRADVHESAHAALEQRGEVERRRPRIPVVRRLERVEDRARLVLERPTLRGVDAQQVLRHVAAQEVDHVSRKARELAGCGRREMRGARTR